MHRAATGQIALDLGLGRLDPLLADDTRVPSTLTKPCHEAILARYGAGAHALPDTRDQRLLVHAVGRCKESAGTV